jgi:hypothetical protein
MTCEWRVDENRDAPDFSSGSAIGFFLNAYVQMNTMTICLREEIFSHACVRQPAVKCFTCPMR